MIFHVQMLNAPRSVRDDDIESMEFLNTIPRLCPNLRKLNLGHRRPDLPHTLSTDEFYADEDLKVRCESTCTGDSNSQSLGHESPPIIT